ncbi:MAG TPA: flagellar biosynthetic protein FliO [Halanaerobiales bacterium]|nr:flagellar biosynthetic protein FliO [Halanaerobiales bacterium]
MNYSLEIIKIAFYLLLVLGIIYLTAYLYKNKMMGQKQGRYIRVLDRTYLNSKASLILLEVNERVLLLGISDNKIELLNEWESGEFQMISGERNKSFRDYLQSFTGKYRDVKNDGCDDNEH